MSEKKNQSFEEMLHRLEEIVRGLDRVDTPLEEALALFEEGAALVKNCTRVLDEAQQKVALLTLSPDGTVTEGPLDKTEA
ncbi:MAG: exodeoxyribonuclease VII small subunit [Clostridia bacterium]|nr:exodeoxyribonuclease VII small subunit [Clostridia bacterium]